MPLMSMADRLAAAALTQYPGLLVTGLRSVTALRWLICDQPRRLRTEVGPLTGTPDGVTQEAEVQLLAWREASDPALSRFELVAKGTVQMAPAYRQPPAPMAALQSPAPQPDPYESGVLIHGPAFQILRQLAFGQAGSTGLLDAGGGTVPPGILGQLLLDGITHTMPTTGLHHWSDQIPAGQVAYPTQIRSVSFHGPTPTQDLIRCELRLTEPNKQRPVFHVQLLRDERVWAEMWLECTLLPLGPLGSAPTSQRRAFLQGRQYVPGVGLSRSDGDQTLLTPTEVRGSNWLPGSLELAYAVQGDAESLTVQIAAKEHVARQAQVHPATVQLEFSADGHTISATCDAMPLNRYPLELARQGEQVVIRSAAESYLDLTRPRIYWRNSLAMEHWPLEDLYFGLTEKYVRRVILQDPPALRQLQGKSMLYLGNHQTAVESLMFALLGPAIAQAPLICMAKSEVRTRWLDRFLTHAAAYPGADVPDAIVYVEQKDPLAMLRTLQQFRESMANDGLSAMVHMEGTRSAHCGQPVTQLSSTLIDMAIAVNAPVVPIRFYGGLPVDGPALKHDVPVGHGTQDIYIGRPIMPAELSALPYAERRAYVLAATNALGPSVASERPNPPDPEFAQAVEDWMAKTGVGNEDTFLLQSLLRMQNPCAETQQVIDGVRHGHLRVPNTPKGLWLAELARRLYGEGGPTVIVDGEEDPRFSTGQEVS